MAKQQKHQVIATSWGAHRIKRIRIGSYDRCGIFTEIDSVAIQGDEYSDAEADPARALASPYAAHAAQGFITESEMAMKQFWVVWNVGGGAPTFQHDAEHSALLEAERLAARNPGEAFV